MLGVAKTHRGIEPEKELIHFVCFDEPVNRPSSPLEVDPRAIRINQRPSVYY